MIAVPVGLAPAGRSALSSTSGQADGLRPARLTTISSLATKRRSRRSPTVSRRFPQRRGHALIEIPDSSPVLEMPRRPSFMLTWLHRDNGPSLLVEAVAALPEIACVNPFIWGGAEASIARGLRAWAKTWPNLNKQNVHVLDYWKIGAAEGSFGASL